MPAGAPHPAPPRADKPLAGPLPDKRDAQAVSKANEAIAIRPKRGKLTLLSRRIYNVFLYHAQRQGVDRLSYSIRLSELIHDARFTSNNTELLKTHIRDMQATTIEWYTSSGGTRQWTSTQLLGTVLIDEPGRGQPCTITWGYPEPIRERLVRPAQYTRVLLEISAQMRSYAASVLYELGARYLTSPGRLTMREDVVWWASVLTGRSDITTVDYSVLRRDTIRKALAELDTLSEDFRLEVVEHKRGRQVVELQFRVLPKPPPFPEPGTDAAPRVFDLKLVDRMVALGLRRSEAQDLYACADEGLLRAAIDHVERRARQPGLAPLKSSAAYLRDALKKAYASPPDGAATVLPAVAPPTVDQRLAALRDDWHQHRSTQVRQRFDALPPDEQQQHIQRFEAERLPGLPPAMVRAWQRDGVRSRVAGGNFFGWLAPQLWPEADTDRQLLLFAIARDGA